MHVLITAVWYFSTLSRISITTAQDTIRPCACTAGSCDYTNVCSPTPNCTRENVALGKLAFMSSLFAANEPSGPACVAVNGNTDTLYKPAIANETNPNCIHTGEEDRNAYWLVNLGRKYTIRNITVYIRTVQAVRMDGVIITVDEQECYSFPSGQTSTPSRKDVSCNVPRKGNIVKFYKNGTGQLEYYLNFCEVEVWVCIPGLFGVNCDYNCNCKGNEICDNLYGTCPTGCSDGFYGYNCSQRFGQCKDVSSANASNGQCLSGCKDGWQEPMCVVCKSGFYGQHCQACGKCIDSQPCNSTNGICTNGCADGYEPPPLCNEVCKNGFYGPNCNSTCGFCNANQPCNKENGTCVDGCADGYESPECVQKCFPGMWGRNCQNACGACLGWTCRHDSGICDKGCFAGYEGEHCTVLLQQQTAAIVGSVLGAGLLIGGSIVAAVLIWLRRSTLKGKRHHLPRSKDKESPGTAKDNYAMDNLNFKEDVYDKFETEKDVPRPYSVLGKESHDDPAQHSITLENNYEKIATQSQNTSADSKPYEII